MLKRSMLAGLVTGLLISLALVYPVSTTLATRYIPDWENPPAALHNSLQLAFVIVALSCLGLGIVATVLLVRPRSYKIAVKSGAIAGLAAMTVIQILILSPAEGLIRMQDVVQLDPLSGPPTNEQIAEYGSRLSGATANNIVLPLLFAAGIGALVMGALFTLYHIVRYQRLPDASAPEPLPPSPNLLHLVTSGRAMRWPDPQESTWRAAIAGGLLLGGFMGLQALFGLSQEFGGQSTEQGLLELLAGPGLNAAVAWLAPLTPIIMFFWGVVVLALQRTPTSRFGSRVWACTIAGGVAGLALQVTFINHMLRLNAPMFHLFMFSQEQASPTAPPDALPYVPLIKVLMFFGAPILSLVVTFVTGTVLGFIQGLIYATVVPLVPGFKRPVDAGQRAYGIVQRNPNEVLPTIWELFRRDSGALEAVAHLAIHARAKRDPSVAQLAAAYHTTVMHPEATGDAVDTIAAVLAEHPDWRWRAEISELYRLLQAALATRDVADIAIIALPPKERTSSLPKPLMRALDHLAAIIRTLKKYERVDSLGGQILFLNNALDAIAQAQEFVRQGMRDPIDQRTTYPEQQSLGQILVQWQTMILETIRGLRGRAELSANLETRRLPRTDMLHLELRIVNVGLNAAEDVWVQLLENQACKPVPDQDKRGIEILLPGDGRSLEFSLTPTTSDNQDGDLRVVFEVVFNDSVDPQQRFQLADSIAFLDQFAPFQRIFPIPYVTGTPLQSSDMFVGRGEILEFIRNHLLGAYQNNVIVLHGQRRTGKTSILYQLQRVLQDSHICVLVDMQGKAARGLVDFLFSLADDITYALEDLGIEMDPPERAAFEESPEFFFRSRFLREVAKELGERNLLLMFDEFEELQARVEAGRLAPEVFPYLRNLMQHEQKTDFIFAGTHKLEELASEYWSILFNIATYKKISFLSEEETTRLITQPVAPFGLEYDALAVRRIFSVTAGQPYFVQLVCHELVAYHNESERNYLTTYDVESVLGTIIERGEAHFKYMWAGASPRERWVLLGTAEHLAHAETITFAELAAWLRQQEQTVVDAADLPNVLTALERRDILVRTSPDSRRYRFKIDLVRRWISTSRQLRETI